MRNFRSNDRQMFSATCANCGNFCQVPFEPTGEKPVLCDSCFRGQAGGNDRGAHRPRFENSRRDSGSRGRFGGGQKQMFDTVCDKCGSDCQVPFRPTNGKPVYCSNCFEGNEGSDGRSNRGNRSNGNNEEVVNQLHELQYKVDQIISMLNKANGNESIEAKAEEIVVSETNEQPVENIVQEEVKDNNTEDVLADAIEAE